MELRAVMSLVQLWRQQGKTGEARSILSEIYGWFGEGFDTPDLKDAKALLEELEEKATIASGKKSKNEDAAKRGNGETESWSRSRVGQLTIHILLAADC
ncbi:MAG TPA: hypothetical protein VKK81_18110 [Candidatus Binatia bacterium]|nr:hypothetical protein [Candidatus Binatia bacterium]